jgi:hypothetical protein
MNYEAVLETGLECLPTVQAFSGLFSNAEHTLVRVKYDSGFKGWQIGHE